MNLLNLCFDSIKDQEGYIEFRIGGVHKPHCRWILLSELSSHTLPQNTPESFFGPALRTAPDRLGKDNVKCSTVCWVDHDNLIQPDSVLPPSAVVWSGHGWHLYWKLLSPCANWESLEKVNEALAKALHSDSCHNADRILRIPGTLNTKDKEPILCTLSEMHPEYTYSLKSLYVATRLDQKTVKRILTGSTRGFASRSERDMSIIRALVTVGLTDQDIGLIFSTHSCGDKHRDRHTDKGYLSHTIQSIRKSPSTRKGGGKTELTVGDNGYHITTSRGRRRISNFILEPTKLLEHGDQQEDIFLCDVRAAGTDQTWHDIPLPMRSFLNSRTFALAMNKGSWTWLGRDMEVRLLRESLMNQLIANNLPRARAVSVLGRHELGEATYFVAGEQVLSSDGNLWLASNAPIVYINPGREAPKLAIGGTEVDLESLEWLAEALPTLNTPGVIWPLIGWFMAAPLKPELEKYGYRFPILNVFGTRGSGKTTLILRIFHPLLGYKEERSYDANTTRFVTLTLLGSTNAIPIAFSEFRIAAAEGFTRYILLAYDTGHDPRGKANQTTVDYPLTAPFSIDGEDMVEDPAAIERIIAVRMVPSVIMEGSEAWMAFQRIQELGGLGDTVGAYYMHTLRLDVPALLDQAEEDIWAVFENPLPDRIRRNLIVTWLGILAFNSFVEDYGTECLPEEGAHVLEECLSNVYSIKLGRAPTAADSFTELIVNGAARNTKAFPWALEGGILWFQLSPAFEFYVNQRVHQRRATLSRNAIKMQLLELSDNYTIIPEVRILRRKKVWAYGIDLERAHEAGLDIPQSFSQGEYVIS